MKFKIGQLTRRKKMSIKKYKNLLINIMVFIVPVTIVVATASFGFVGSGIFVD
jgi:hypothetical protein